MQKHIVIIGGGAAGFFCAINLALLRKDLKITILEKTGKLLSKVKVSGGGRCNVTHDVHSIAQLAKHYPRGEHFLKKAFHHFAVKDMVEWLAARGVDLKTEADGRMFPQSNTSQTIIDCFLQEANRLGIVIKMSTEVQQIVCKNSFDILLKSNETIQADAVCIATGGYNKPHEDDWAHGLNIALVPPVPSLFTFNLPGNAITNLQGISLPEVKINIPGTPIQEQGPLLITHWGLSGPVVLRASAWGARALAEKSWQFGIRVNWLPQYNEETLRAYFFELRKEKARLNIYHKNPFELPARLWHYFLQLYAIDEQSNWNALPAKEQNKLIKTLCAQELEVKGKTTFKEEFVTAGGINLADIDPGTMQHRHIKGLHFAGEVLDIDGITGGFNFQNAWTTAFIAAKSIAETI